MRWTGHVTCDVTDLLHAGVSTVAVGDAPPGPLPQVQLMDRNHEVELFGRRLQSSQRRRFLHRDAPRPLNRALTGVCGSVRGQSTGFNGGGCVEGLCITVTSLPVIFRFMECLRRPLLAPTRGGDDGGRPGGPDGKGASRAGGEPGGEDGRGAAGERLQQPLGGL